MKDPKAPRPLAPSTLAVHAGEAKHRFAGAIVGPIFQSANFEYVGEGAPGDAAPVRYMRLANTPTHDALHAKLAALCGAEAALSTASGMAAVALALQSVLKAGDHVLVQSVLYGGTHGLLTREAADLGWTFDFVPGDDPVAWASALKPNTRAIYVETMSNPLLQVPDLEAVPRFAREHGLASLIDNTFASPLGFKPLALGYDLELHSATKYMNGHSDLVAGVVCGSQARIQAVWRRLISFGGALDAHAAFLLHRGLKTLVVRVREQWKNAQRLAEYLSLHPGVLRVDYPGLVTHPHHERARRLFAGFGGQLAFEPRGGVSAAERLISRLRLPSQAPSLGGVESLVTRPVTTSHRGLSAAERARCGLTDSLVRVAVGIEDIDDLCADFEQALAD